MRLTQISLANPAAVAVVAAGVVMLGVLSMIGIPAQLLPQIEKPVVTVINAWPGAAPTEIESELTVPVEEVLQGTPGMTEMSSWNMSNFGFMQLEFALETDMTRTLIEIISRLNRLRPLPANAETEKPLANATPNGHRSAWANGVTPTISSSSTTSNRSTATTNG